jgi:DNA polymerase III subunit alpha
VITPLHNHSFFSALDGISSPEEIADRCVEIGCECCGLTDHGLVAGHLHFAKAMQARGLKPVFGMEAYHGLKTQFAPKERDQAHLIVLAQTNEGLRNLWRLTHRTSDEKHFHNVGRVFWQDLKDCREGLIVTSACALSLVVKDILVSQGIIKGDYHNALNQYLEIFGDNFFIEIHTYPWDHPFRDRDSDAEYNTRIINEALIEVARERGIGLLYADDAHRARPDQYWMHDAYIALQTGDSIYTSTEGRSMWHPEDAMVIHDETGVRAALDYLPEDVVDECISNSVLIAESITAQLPEVRRHLPVFVPSDCPWLEEDDKSLSPEVLFIDLVEDGIIERYGEDAAQEVWDRCIYEVETLIRDGIHHYFLMGWDEIKAAQSMRMAIGPGRGSSAGSIVAYALGITDVDPLHYGLIFERFWNSGRVKGFPDIDSDFPRSRRKELIGYLEKRWSKNHVCAIGTVGYMKPKATIDKLSKGCGITFDEAKELKEIVGRTTKIEILGHEQIGWNPEYEPGKVHYVKVDVGGEIERWVGGDRRREYFIKLCEICCSRVKQYGIHASGIVITDGETLIESELPAYRRGGKEGVAATQFAMSDVDDRMFIKLDVLGLRTLDVLNYWDEMMAEHGIEVKWSGLDLQEHPEEMWQMLWDGFTAGIFQVEDGYGKQLCKQMQPRSVEDFSVLGALNRPGPIQAGIPDRYIARRKGLEPVTYPHPILEPILNPTYGLFCVAGNQLVSMADGSMKPLSEITSGEMIHAVDAQWNVQIRKCHGAIPTRFGAGLQMQFDDGSEITVTSDHKMLTPNGMIEAQKLALGDLVATAIHTPSIVQSSTVDIAPWLGTNEDVGYLLGLLIGDAHLTGSSIALCTGMRNNHELLMTWIQNHLPTLGLREYYHTRAWYIQIGHSARLGNSTKKTKWHHLLETLDIKHSGYAKQLPRGIERWSETSQNAFLAGLFDADGDRFGNNKCACKLTAVAPGVRYGVRRLLQLQGVITQITSQRLYVWDTKQLAEILKPFSQIITWNDGVLSSGTMVGWMPREWLRKTWRESTLSQRMFAYQYGISKGTLNGKGPIKHGVGLRCGLGSSQIRFRRLIAINQVQDIQFYGMAVDDDHNFICDQVVVSNCYQEQIIAYFNALNYTLSESDAMRKIMGKKKPQDLAAIRDGLDEWEDRGYFTMARAAGMPQEVAESVWRELEGFADYCFNKSHTVAYAIIGFRTLYAKYYGAVQFYAASIRSLDPSSDGDKRKEILPEIVNECRRLNIEVRPPDIRWAQAHPSVDPEGRLLFGFGDIKGIANSGDYIVALRDMQKIDITTPDNFRARFNSLNQKHLGVKQEMMKAGLWKQEMRSPKQLLRANQIDALEKAGCWDDMGVRDISMTQRQQNEQEMLGVILTDNSAEVLERNAEEIAKCDPWKEMLTPFYEKHYCYGKRVVEEESGYHDYEVCGTIVSVSPKVAKSSGKSFGIVTIEYESDTVEFTVFPAKWKKFKFLFKPRTVGIFTLRHKPADKYAEGYLFQTGFKLT